MSSPVRLLAIRSSCAGPHARLRVDAGEGTVELAAAGLLAECEAEGGKPIVGATIDVGPGAGDEAAAVARWLAEHGRQVFVRGSSPLSRRLVDVLAEIQAGVVLPLGHVRPGVHKALLGDRVADPKAVLLGAQYLRARGVLTLAEFGPLLPGVHDRVGGIDALAKLVDSASVDRARLRLADLRPRQLLALRDVHDAGGVMDLCRALDVPVRVLFGDGSWPPDSRWRISPLAAAGLVASCARTLREHGIAVSPCGCPGSCAWVPRREQPLGVGPADLFAELGLPSSP